MRTKNKETKEGNKTKRPNENEKQKGKTRTKNENKKRGGTTRRHNKKAKQRGLTAEAKQERKMRTKNRETYTYGTALDVRKQRGCRAFATLFMNGKKHFCPPTTTKKVPLCP